MNLPFPGYFIDKDKLYNHPITPGISAELAWGEKIMLSRVTIQPDGLIPDHSHPHEQAGICVEGKFELTINGESRVIYQGEMYLIPVGVSHTARGIGEVAVALDIFSPVREDYLPN